MCLKGRQPFTESKSGSASKQYLPTTIGKITEKRGRDREIISSQEYTKAPQGWLGHKALLPPTFEVEGTPVRRMEK